MLLLLLSLSLTFVSYGHEGPYVDPNGGRRVTAASHGDEGSSGCPVGGKHGRRMANDEGSELDPDGARARPFGGGAMDPNG